MAPKNKFTKEQIVAAALNVVREGGISSLTAKTLAEKLGTSTRPIFTAFATMDNLKNENFNIDFKDDIQIIYGENEAGKSTLMDFIKLMFYRKEGYEKASAKDKEIREKYYPRSKKEMKGSIEFESHGTLFKIYKEIDSKSHSKDSICTEAPSSCYGI